MTQEEKKILLKDLCARSPYGVKITDGLNIIKANPLINIGVFVCDGTWKPYLRPMSSMTEEEKIIQKTYIYHFSGNNLPNYEGDFVFEDEVHEYIDWLNSRHFDYRGLIGKGLAIEVTEEKNPYNL